MNRWLYLLGLLALTSLSASCMVNPVTGQQELSLVSADQEIAIGAQQYAPAQQSQGGRYYIDPEVQRYVNEVGQQLAKVSDRPDLPYEFVVLNNAVPNAWALPGGKIALNRGLLVHLQDESQLAAVLAHEIVHAAARHSATQMSRGMLAGIGLQVLDTATGSHALGGMAAQIGASAFMARYGRAAELESDAYGMDYMARAGYDPHGAVSLQKKFVELSKNRQQDFLSGLFASHPPSQERVAANRAKAQTMPAAGVRNQERFVKKMARIHRDLPAYTAQEEAVAAMRAKAPEKALDLLDRAIRLQPDEGQFWELRGHAWKMLKDDKKAGQAFNTAVSKNPHYFSHYLARGIHAFAQGQQDNAQRDLESSRQLLPTAVASLYLGDIAVQRGDKQTARAFYQEAAQDSGEIGKAARAKLSALEVSLTPNHPIGTQLALDSSGWCC